MLPVLSQRSIVFILEDTNRKVFVAQAEMNES